MIRENKLENDWDCLGLNRVRSCKSHGQGFIQRVGPACRSASRLAGKATHMAGARLPIHEHRIRRIGVRQPSLQLPTMLLTLGNNQPQGKGHGLEGFCKREGPMMKEWVEPLQEQKLREAVRTTASANQRPTTNEGVNARVRDSRQIAAENTKCIS